MKYIGIYSCRQTAERRLNASPAANAKMEYVITALRAGGTPVELIDPAWSKAGDGRRWPAQELALREGVLLRLFATFAARRRWTVPLQWLQSMGQLFFYLLRETQPGETILAYHTPYTALPLAWAHKLRHFRLVLEVEEIYQDVLHLPAPIARAERSVLQCADAYLLSARALRERVDANKPNAVIHGAYLPVAAQREAAQDGRIHCLYSGTFDEAKNGAYLAIRAAEYLPEAYCVHISGFGTGEQTERVRQQIEAVRGKARCGLVYEGFLDDAAYQALLARCQIGLNTQTPDEKFSDTCFPSKILTYLTHGLQVVSSQNRAVTDSDVGALLTYYTEQTPQAVARAVEAAAGAQQADPRRQLQILHEHTCTALQELVR